MRKIISEGRQISYFLDDPIINEISEEVLTKMREKDYTNIVFEQVKSYSRFIIVFDCKKWEKLELKLMKNEANRDLFATIESVKELRV